jgi:hypothetical protein
MTPPNPSASKSATDEKQKAGVAAANASTDLPFFKPRPVLFVILGIILALWLGAIGLMRLRMVIRPAAPAPSSQPARE